MKIQRWLFNHRNSKKARLRHALNELRQGQIEPAFWELAALVSENCAEAEYQLATIYEHHFKKPQEALSWYRRAAVHGHGAAHQRLAELYTLGLLVPRDVHRAVSLYHLAARLHVAEAQFMLGEFYRQGDLVERDTEAAFQWYLRAWWGGIKLAKARLDEFWKNGVFLDS